MPSKLLIWLQGRQPSVGDLLQYWCLQLSLTATLLTCQTVCCSIYNLWKSYFSCNSCLKFGMFLSILIVLLIICRHLHILHMTTIELYYGTIIKGQYYASACTVLFSIYTNNTSRHSEFEMHFKEFRITYFHRSIRKKVHFSSLSTYLLPSIRWTTTSYCHS